MLNKKIGGIIPVQVTAGKVTRAKAVSHLVESGNVWLPDPENAPWVWDFIEECAAFPDGDNDDQVDQMTQALNDRHTKTGSQWGPA